MSSVISGSSVILDGITLHEQLLNALGNAVLATDLNGTIVFWNRAAEELYGWSAEEVCGRNVLEITASRATKIQARQIMARLSSGQSWSGEFIVRRRDGSEFPAHVTDSPIHDARGVLVGIVGVSYDLTAEKEAERLSARTKRLMTQEHKTIVLQRDKLLSAAARAAEILSTRTDFESAAGLALRLIGEAAEADRVYAFENHVDESSGMTLTSQRFEWTSQHADPQINNPQLQQMPVDLVLGPWAARLSAGEHVSVLTHDAPDSIRRILEDQSILSLLIVPIIIDGEWRGFLGLDDCTRGRTWSDAEHTVLRTIANILGGLLKRRQAGETLRKSEEGLRVALERAEEMVRLKQTFLANMSHEIRTPLTGIIGFAGFLSEIATGETREYAEIIETNGHRLLDTINSVLDLAQLESKTLNIAPVRFDVVHELRQIVGLVQNSADEKGLHLTIEFQEPKIPLITDRGAFGRMCTNLISNAIKFTRKGSVIVFARSTANGAEVEVVDTGIGIDPSFLPHLFDEFSQESSGLTRRYHGNGLGLPITRRLAELVNAHIEVESEKGRGSRFLVRFTNQHGEVEDHEPDYVGAPATQDEKPRLLVVEDSVQTQRLIQAILSTSYEIDLASGYRDAVTQASVHEYDAVLIDINLGGKDNGVDVLNFLRSLPAFSGTRMVACTAYALPGDETRFRDEGFDGYVSKPFRRSTLLGSLAGTRKSVTDGVSQAPESE